MCEGSWAGFERFVSFLRICVFEKCDRQVSEDCIVWTEEGLGWEINVYGPDAEPLSHCR
jgi:hypothetical protein